MPLLPNRKELSIVSIIMNASLKDKLAASFVIAAVAGSPLATLLPPFLPFPSYMPSAQAIALSQAIAAALTGGVQAAAFLAAAYAAIYIRHQTQVTEQARLKGRSPELILSTSSSLPGQETEVRPTEGFRGSDVLEMSICLKIKNHGGGPAKDTTLTAKIGNYESDSHNLGLIMDMGPTKIAFIFRLSEGIDGAQFLLKHSQLNPEKFIAFSQYDNIFSRVKKIPEEPPRVTITCEYWHPEKRNSGQTSLELSGSKWIAHQRPLQIQE